MRAIETGSECDMQIDGSTWLSSLGGALINDAPLMSYESSDIPTHRWLESKEDDIVIPSIGIMRPSEITISIAANSVSSYKRIVTQLASGGLHSLYFPFTDASYSNLYFSRTSNPQFIKESLTEQTVTFDLTMKATTTD